MIVDGDLLPGNLVNVEDEQLGSVATAAAGIGATFIYVDDLNDFDFDGGTLKTPAGQVVDFTVPTDLSRLNLAVPLTSAVAVGDFIAVDPPAYESFAAILPPNATEPLPARIPIGLRGVLRSGARDIAVAEDVRYGYDPDPASNDLVLAELRGELPSVDATFVDTTLALPSDSHPPASSPTPTVQGGPTFLAVTWAEVANADPVTYEVHVSTTTGFVPDSSTKYAELRGTGIIVKNLPGGTALVYGTTYYVKLIAKDPDGAAPTSVQGSGAMVQINTPDLAANAITANEIAAGAVTAGKINVTDLSAINANLGSIVSGTITGGTIQTASGTPRTVLDSSGLWMSMTSSTGSLAESIRWLNSGTQVMSIVPNFNLGGKNFMSFFMTDYPNGAAQPAGIKFQTPTNGTPTSAYFVSASARGLGVAIIRGDGTSDFLQHTDLAANGLLVRTASGAYAERTLGAGTGISLTNPDGVAGAPSIAIDTAVVPRLAAINPFTTRQQIAPATDVPALDLRRGTDTSPTALILRLQRADAAANLLTVDAFGHLATNAGVETKVVAGVVSDANFGATPGSGSLAVDTSGNDFYVRVGTTWKRAGLGAIPAAAFTLPAYTANRAPAAPATITLAETARALFSLVDDLKTAGVLK